ncbi:ABC transporter permease [Delftia acidovorans]|uniref:ABC transporter permease n=1 Tax=Delftia acidovorans TaxID=80866 RepID=UPI0028EB18EB|nr:ABC transporter permease [Delftia acidovorans]
MPSRISRSALLGLAILALFVVTAALAGWLYPGDPLDMAGPALLWPLQDPAFALGTDALGRDLAAQLAHGARASLQVGACAALVGLSIGTVAGAVGGYYGGWADKALTRLTELFQTTPTLLMAVVIVAIAGPSSRTVAFAIGLASWPGCARLVRAQFRQLREADFVLAARSQGFGDLHIICREILPNALAPVIVTASAMVASAILLESALSFLGIGDPEVLSWGGMIGAGRDALRTDWYLSTLPGAAISVVVLALNLVGDALNDHLNPRLRGR